MIATIAALYAIYYCFAIAYVLRPDYRPRHLAPV